MSVTTAIRDLLAKGFTVEQALEAAEAFEAAMQPTRTARQERNARYYQNKKATKASEKRLKASDTSNSDESVLNKTPPRTRVEDNLQTTEIAGSEEKKDTAPAALSDLQGFKAELSELDAERVEAIVKHRRSKKAQLTAHAARLFKADAQKAGLSLAAAVDTCISRNWITVKADWLEGRQAKPRGSPPKPISIGQMFVNDAIEMGLINEPANPAPRRVEAGDGSREGGGTGITRRFTVPTNLLGRIG